MEHILYWLWLTNALTFSKIKKIHKSCGNVENIFILDNYDNFTFLDETDKEALCDKRLAEARCIYDECIRLGIQIIVWDDRKNYPPMLRHISQPPLILYAKGIIPDWKSIFTFGIVGTRKMTDYGEQLTETFTENLVKAGVTVVTGFARGNDIVATRVALKHNSFTIALLGGGVDIIYPPEHYFEYHKLLKNGLFLSEQPPGSKPQKWNFPKRNRILAGICNGILVTEAPKVSGALITAHVAGEEGRDVFAIPGNITKPTSNGTNILIQEGAKPVMSCEDIFCEYPALLSHIEKIKASAPEEDTPEEQVTKTDNSNTVPQSSKEEIILSLLADGDMMLDNIMSQSGLTGAECNSVCFMLELTGKITRLPGNIYHLN